MRHLMTPFLIVPFNYAILTPLFLIIKYQLINTKETKYDTSKIHNIIFRSGSVFQTKTNDFHFGL